MTKVMTEGGWVYIVLVIDWFSKKIGTTPDTKVEAVNGYKP